MGTNSRGVLGIVAAESMSAPLPMRSMARLGTGAPRMDMVRVDGVVARLVARMAAIMAVVGVVGSILVVDDDDDDGVLCYWWFQLNMLCLYIVTNGFF